MVAVTRFQEGGSASPADPLEALARQTAADGIGQVEGQNEPGQADPEAAANFAKMQAGFAKFTLGGLKALRAMVARKLPEIHSEWTDESLKDLADAAFPVANKYLAKLMPFMGEFPEETALAMAALPLVLGYVSAAEKNAQNAAQAQAAWLQSHGVATSPHQQQDPASNDG